MLLPDGSSTASPSSWLRVDRYVSVSALREAGTCCQTDAQQRLNDDTWNAKDKTRHDLPPGCLDSLISRKSRRGYPQCCRRWFVVSFAPTPSLATIVPALHMPVRVRFMANTARSYHSNREQVNSKFLNDRSNIPEMKPQQFSIGIPCADQPRRKMGKMQIAVVRSRIPMPSKRGIRPTGSQSGGFAPKSAQKRTPAVMGMNWVVVFFVGA
jgi:hypothetical protein